MHKDPFSDFTSCFDKSYDVIVSDKELQEKFDTMNQWLKTLTKEDALQNARKVQNYLIEAISSAEKQRDGLGEQLQANKKQVKANLSYSKF